MGAPLRNSRMNNPSHQDWAPVVLKKTTPAPKAGGSGGGGGGAGGSKMAKLDAAEEAGKIATVDKALSKKIMQARTAKKMSQKQLAQVCGVQANVIQTYENGKAVPNQQIITKIEKALGCQLREKKFKGKGGKK